MFIVEMVTSRMMKKLVWFVVSVIFFEMLIEAFHMYRNLMEEHTASFIYFENDEDLENPARGFYTQIYYKEPERLEAIREDGQTLALVTMSLSDHLEEAIPEEKLNRLRTMFEEARKQQMMLLFRASYRADEEWGEPELPIIKSHIEQISEVINEYKDVVLVVQTGMIGLWGEWHGSVYLEDEEALRNEAMKVVQWWLQSLDPSINLNLRRPLFIQTAIEEGLDGSRLGMHNDALLATESDMGTYVDRTEELQWCKDNLNGKVNGGEMPYVSKYTEPDYAVREFDQLSLMYLNACYNVDVLKDWKKKKLNGENAFDYFNRHLGYRYSLRLFQTTDRITQNSQSFQVKIQLKNSGFSTIQSRFHLYLFFDDGIEKRFILLEKENGEKDIEVYQCSVELPEKRPFVLGLCYTDGLNEEEGRLEEYSHTVKFANNEILYEEGINYVIRYQYIEGKENELVPQKIYKIGSMK